MPNARVPIREFEEKLKTVSQTDWIRLAAFIDGEGSIYIGRYERKSGGIQYNLELVVSGTSPLLMRWLTATFGGNSYLSYPTGKSALSNLVCASWKLPEERAELVLRNCLPYFIIKREQAEVALAYRELKKQGAKWQKVTPEIVQQRDDLRDRLRVLNSPKFAAKTALDAENAG